MSDYIKREDAIERLSYHADFYQNDREFGGEEMLYKDSALNEISELPSADVVEVVRCKDCKYDHKCSHNIIRPSKGGGVIYCPLEYCSEGENNG